MSFSCQLFWIWEHLFLNGVLLSFQDMIQLCFSLMTRVSLPQTACSSALLSLCEKDFLIPTQNASSSGQVRGCLSHLQWTWRSQLGSLQAEDDWGLECLGKVFFICLLCFLTSPDIHLGAVRDVILGGKLLVWCSIDIFRRQNPVYCVLLHNSLFCPRGVLLMLLCSSLHNSNFFQFPFTGQDLRPLISILWTPPCPHHIFLGPHYSQQNTGLQQSHWQHWGPQKS